MTAGPEPLGTVGESIHAEPARPPRAAAARARHDLLDTARRLLWDPDAATHSDQHATCWCHRATFNEAGTVPLHRAVDGSSARFGGLVTCGLVWTCPVCCAKIAEQRRLELAAAQTEHVANGGRCYLLTFTFPHDRHQRLAEQLEGLMQARQRFQNSRAWKAWKERAERIGAVTSLEVTVGHNGWHPHLHMLVFAKPQAFGEGEPINADGDLWSTFIGELAGLWVDQLVKVGLCSRSQLGDATRHALNVRGGDQAAEYIAKYGRDERYGLGAELTLAHSKTAGRRVAPKTWHYTPFQLLQLIREQADDVDRWVTLWHEYVQAMAGKRMLTWSPGLKAALDVVELSDEQIAAQAREPQAEEQWVATLTYQQFVQVSACSAQGRLIEFVARYGGRDDAQAQVNTWIALECRRPTTDGDVLRRFAGSHKLTALPPS